MIYTALALLLLLAPTPVLLSATGIFLTLSPLDSFLCNSSAANTNPDTAIVGCG